MATVLEASKEEATVSRSRTTKDGRKITYCMKVVQQPERARACGQGAKSSTDRRPVDPPPIIDLRIFEGEGANETDITFSYRANFFVWASLEHARPIAQGRVSQSAMNTPVLCGTPVAGISYLDRPQPAGYFIFPDLSVRHEGKYVINFTLYEDLKDRRFEDAEPQDNTAGEFVNGRCEIKSLPFVVFSAKKFPGLAESTALSRLVADQGCRVRIRRDVRMRRRENNGPKDWDDYEDATADQRARHASTPHHEPAHYPQASIHPSRAPSGEPPARQRSNSIASNVSVHHQPPHQAVSEWPPQEVAHTYQQMGPGGTPISSQPSAQYYRGPGASHEPATMAPYTTAPYTASQYISNPPMPPSPQHMPNAHMSPYPMNVPPTWGYGPPPQMHSPAYGPPVNHLRHASMSYPSPAAEYSAPPGHPQYQHSQSQPSTPLAVESSGYGRPMHQLYPNGSQAQAPPTQNPPPFTTSLPPLRGANNGFDRGTPGSALPNPNPPQGGYVSQPPPPQYVSQMLSGAPAQKRNFGSVFDTRHIDQPLRGGARPNVMAAPQSAVGFEGNSDHSSSDDDSLELERLQMEYRRADGTKVQRRWPSSH